MSGFDPKIAATNACLATFAPGTSIDRRPGGWFVRWRTYQGEERSRRWACRGQDFYPTWSRKWGHGGTATTALSQLIRWSSGKPVFPAATWWYWSSPTIALLPPEAVRDLLAAGYPEHAPCVLCGQTIAGGLDWWHLDGVSGPCCGMRSGCEQKARPGGAR